MKKLIFLTLIFFAVNSCGIYTFSGTSITPDIKSITVNNIVNKAMRVNPSLSGALTEALVERYRKFTSLDTGSPNGDLEVSGIITSYELVSVGVTANEKASKNRLSVTIKIKFENKKHPKENFDKSYASYGEYDSTISFDSAESALVDEIIKKLVEMVFNDTVAKWS